MICETTSSTSQPTPCQARAPNLLSWEREVCVVFLRASQDQREAILSTARKDPKASGSLLFVLAWLMTA